MKCRTQYVGSHEPPELRKSSHPQVAKEVQHSTVSRNKRLAVTSFRCLAVMLPEGGTMARLLSGCPSLSGGSRGTEVGFEPQTSRLVNSRSNHLSHLTPGPV
ncbi:hypothetical protein T265_03795 [Opisthorchis viverrini]|uniref:Uncharacterized protein n=1 Tax=Opisthorchis viverrini TaxID=6198 RepID=A0A074ZQA1_OPIVI|nr:hypothetical protein T265_03795 [Opisthorchis viverrini]KER29593.1 hypothetical protein T265_03795 [Opisthorchis viverrini]